MENKIRYTLSKEQRITGRKDIDALFKNAQSFSVYPLRILYLPHKEDDLPVLRAGFSVGTKYFKKAVDRNRIKRLLRESYRLQRFSLNNHLEEANGKLNLFIIYTGKEIFDYTYIFEKVGNVLRKVEDKINIQQK